VTIVDESVPKAYALVSHESAVEGIWALAASQWKGILDNEDIWMVPAAENCVKTQKDFKMLDAEVDLASLGIRDRPVDLLVPDKACFSRGRLARFHVWSDFFPSRSFVRVRDRVFISTPYFAVLQLAMSRRPNRFSRAAAEDAAAEDARFRAELGLEGKSSTAEELMRWDNIARFVRSAQVLCDFMGTYRYVPTTKDEPEGPPSIVYKQKPIVRPEVLREYLTEIKGVRGMKGARGIRRARKVAATAFPLLASPMETMLALMFTLPCDMGGFGLPRPQVNWSLPMEKSARDLFAQDEVVIDFCWSEQRVAVEYYGWKEHYGGQNKVAADATRANGLAALGWAVYVVTYKQVCTIAGVTLLARQVAAGLGMHLAEPSELELLWRSRLLAALLPKSDRQL
jgi:hypothetical protein